MRRDVCYFFETDVKTLYNAYLKSAQQPPFEKSCNEEPYHTFSFGIGFTFKYNMNGGACTLHFMPYKNGSAVNLRFSIAQLMGARCQKYAEHLTNGASAILNLPGTKINIDVEQFLIPANQVTKAVADQPQDGIPQEPSITGANFCRACGSRLSPGYKFCASCGTKIE